MQTIVVKGNANSQEMHKSGERHSNSGSLAKAAVTKSRKSPGNTIQHIISTLYIINIIKQFGKTIWNMPYILPTAQKVVLVDEKLKFCPLSDGTILSYLLKGGEAILAVRYE